MCAKKAFVYAAIALAGLLTTAGWSQQQQISGRERGQVLDMLHDVADDVRKHYYDPKFHGVDWDAQVKEAKQKIDKAETMNLALAEIAAALDTLHDSHTFFVPPQRPYRHDYGWQPQMIGDRCYVVRVRPNSDADAKDVRPGDEVLAINGYTPIRDNLWKIQYMFNILRPQPGLHLHLRDPRGGESQADVAAKITELVHVRDLTGNGIWPLLREIENEEHLMRIRYAEVGDDLMVLKFPTFFFPESGLDDIIGKARKHKALILDLRGNPGGSVDTLGYLIGHIFENNVKVADRVGRDTKKPEVVKVIGHNHFSGKLVVLVDSQSASAAEIFARLVQIEKRGVVLGDQTSGHVMEAKEYSYQIGMGTVVLFGASITDADLIMSDGKSLEHTGVTPDETVLPTAADLANERDPVLAHAALTLGVQLTPEQAGKMLPYEWPQQ